MSPSRTWPLSLPRWDLERCLFGPSRSGPASERPRSQVQGLAGLRSISAVLPTAWNCPPTAPAAAPLSCLSLRSRPVSFVHSVQCRRAVLHTPKLSLRDPPSRGRRLPFIPFHVALAGAASCLAPRRAPSSLSFFVDSFSASPPTNQPTAPTAPPPVAPPDRDDSLTFPPRSFCFCALRFNHPTLVYRNTRSIPATTTTTTTIKHDDDSTSGCHCNFARLGRASSKLGATKLHFTATDRRASIFTLPAASSQAPSLILLFRPAMASCC